MRRVLCAAALAACASSLPARADTFQIPESGEIDVVGPFGANSAIDGTLSLTVTGGEYIGPPANPITGPFYSWQVVVTSYLAQIGECFANEIGVHCTRNFGDQPIVFIFASSPTTGSFGLGTQIEEMPFSSDFTPLEVSVFLTVPNGFVVTDGIDVTPIPNSTALLITGLAFLWLCRVLRRQSIPSFR